MNEPYLQVTYRQGRAFAAYYYLPRGPSDKSVRSLPVESGLVVDFAADGSPIGIEITDPSSLTVEVFNRVLDRLGLPSATARDLQPLHAA